MPTYYNGYTLLERVRQILNEYSTAYCQGTDTTGAYQNSQIMEGINAAQYYIYNLLFTRIPQAFEEEVSLTGVNSVYTLPANFGVLRYFKDSNGNQIHKLRTNERRTTSGAGSKQRYYRKNNTLVLDRAGLTDTCTLIYYRKPREIIQGVSSAGGAASVTLASTAKGIADYYNGLAIENITDNTIDEISDYSAARVATVTNTWAASKYYGTVSDIPDMFHYLIIPRAIFEITGNYPVVQEKPQKAGVDFFMDQLLVALRAYTRQDHDEYPEDIWASYGSESLIPSYYSSLYE